MTIKKKIYLSAGVLSLLLMLTAIFAYASAFIIGNVSNNILKAYSPALTINSQISTHYSDGRADVRTVTQKYDEALYNEANQSIDAMMIAINDLDKHLKTGKNASIMNVMREYVDKALSLSARYKQLSDDSMKMRKSIEDLTANFMQKANEMEKALGDVYTNTIEGAWSHLKRSMMGTYHRPSKEHLSKYCAEFEFTYNTRKKTPLAKFNQIIDKNLIRVGYTDIVGT